MSFTPFLSADWDKPNSHTLEFYESQGGYKAFKAVLDKDPKELIETVKASGLRGRGGAGFPTGMKWGFVPQNTGKPIYLVINADESEPGTFKDKPIMTESPHMMMEGIMIAAKAINSHHAFVYMRGEFIEPYKRMKECLKELYDKGYLGKGIFGSDFDLECTLARGAGAYICGEETGLLTSLEGDRGNPKLKPPFPAVSGYLKSPTVVNNVETVANLPFIFNNGLDWWKSIGTEKSPGSKLFCMHGHIEKPGVIEVPLGTPLMEMIEMCGGVWKGKKLKAVIPGGSSAPILTAQACQNLNMDYESIAAAGSMLGSGGVTILDETVSIPDAIWNLMRFYHHESCGQCTPCREGTGWLEKIVARMVKGGGTRQDLETIEQICTNMQGRTICALADAAVLPMRSYVENFRHEFEALIKEDPQVSEKSPEEMQKVS